LSYGIEAAARTYFNTNTQNLSLAQSALLVGLLSSPDAGNPYVNMKEAKRKQEVVLDLMVKDKFITREQGLFAKQEEITLHTPQEDIKAPHFVHYVLDEADRLGIKSGQGVNIYTTLDYPIFELSTDVAKLWVDRLRDEHDLSNAAVVLLDNKSGAILSMMGGIDYFDASRSGQVNMATALRQPGSALKPVTYATAFARGYTPATLIYDVKKVYKTKKGEGFTPNNYDGMFHGLVLAREALASSLNLPAVEMLSRVGIPAFLKTARAMGVSTLKEENRYDLALTLGGGEVKLLELTNVFASFARGGAYKPPYAIEKITADSGQVLYLHHDEAAKDALGKNSKQIAYLITDILSDPSARIPGFGAKNPLLLSHPAAVKTGTTTDWHDNWTVGYTPSYTVGVWAGNNDNQAMREITGVTGAAPIWNQFFEEFLKGKPIEQFSQPAGITSATICAVSGQLPDALCPDKKIETFIAGTEPKQTAQIYKKVTIDTRNNLLASPSCPPEYTQEKVFLDYPPEVYTWAVEDGQEVIPREYSPLCNANSLSSGSSYLQITYPREKTVFESAPYLVYNQAAVFEVSVSPDIEKVIWQVDGRVIHTTYDFPFKQSWPLVLGKHTISAVGVTRDGKEVKGGDVYISVVEFQGN
ncbi:MAG: penicillin-binding transpeptidase domain-containing protein, partial [Candidatus Levyibacteriota bacterium]